MLSIHKAHPDFWDAVDAFLDCVRDEVKRAAKKFPTNEDKLAAFSEEAGEVAKAFLDHKYGKGATDDVYEELTQAAAVAAILSVVGTAEMPYPWPSNAENEKEDA